jgi:protein SCO1/2
MRALLASFLVTLLLVACRQEPPARQYELQGQIVGIEQSRNEIMIKHGDIKGFMPAMTMPFTVKDGGLLTGKQPGDLVTATLVVTENSAHLSSLTRTGHAALDVAPAPVPAAVLVPGDLVPDATLIDQDGKPRSIASLRGHRVAITFIYTRCPLPDFCPLMDRQFAAVQRTLQDDASMRDVRLVSVTLDPEFDTPAILQRHAARYKANPAVWSFLTGEPKDVAAFSHKLGIYTERDLGTGANLTHNLRTVVIDPEGRLAKAHSGNDWKPADLVADLKAITAPSH